MSNVVEIQSAPRSALTTAKADRSYLWGGFEPFVDETVVAEFLGIEPRRVLEMARKRQIPAHPLGDMRKTWRFRISEIDAHFGLPFQKHIPATISLKVPVIQERRRVG